MKKKILLSVLTLFVFAVCAFSVNATTLLNVETSQEAKAPSKAYGSDTTLYSVVGNDFDLSKLKFGEVTGTTKFEKIYLGTINQARQTAMLQTPLVDETTGKPNLTLDIVFGNTWFTAYCLDGTKKYPTTGIYSYPDFYTNLLQFEGAKQAFQTAYAAGNTEGITAAQTQMLNYGQKLVDYVVYAALTNSTATSVQNAFKAKEDYKTAYSLDYAGRNNLYFITTLLGNLQTAKGGTTGFTVNVIELNVSKGAQTETINASELAGGTATTIDKYSFYATATTTEGTTTYSCPTGTTVDENDETICWAPLGSNLDVYPLHFASTDILFNKLKLSGNLDGYEHALWILEHTYPSLTLSEALEAAGTSLDAVKAEVKTLYSIEDADVQKYTENVVYGVIQYALWKATKGVDPANATIGNTVTNASGTALTELNKLYDYLIREREEYTGYGSTTYTNEITLSKPAAGKEIFKESKTAYTYGPYTATYSVLEADGMNISAKNDSAELSKIKFIDESGNTITKLTNGQKFYVVVEKSAKIGSVKLHLDLVNPVGFNPATNRGKVYSPIFVNAQNVMTGGKIESITVEKDFDLVYNPKTGVENIAVLLMVTLVAFSLGYLVLSYRSKPVGLN